MIPALLLCENVDIRTCTAYEQTLLKLSRPDKNEQTKSHDAVPVSSLYYCGAGLSLGCEYLRSCRMGTSSNLYPYV